MFRFIAGLIGYFRSKGVFFWFNVAIFAGIIFLTLPFFNYRSSNPVIFGYSVKYFIGLLLFAFLIGYLAVLVLISGKLFNKVLFFSIIGILLISKLGFTFFGGSTHAVKDILGYSVPYVMYTGEPNSEQISADKGHHWGTEIEKVKLNELGFRIERPLSKEKTTGETRVFILGGSTVFNGYPLSNSIGGQVEKLFHKAGHMDVKVYNFGMTGYVSGQELALILHTLVDYKPDLIITYDGNNDIYQPYGYDPRPGYPLNFMVLETGMSFVKNELSWAKLVMYAFNRLFWSVMSKNSLTKSAFIFMMEKQFFGIDQLRKSVDYGTPEWESALIKKYADNLEKNCSLAKGFDFKVVSFLQPVLCLKPSLVGNEKNLLIGNEFQAYMTRQYDRARPVFKDLAAKYSKSGRCFFFDMSDIFKDCKEEIYWDFVHTNNKGNRIIAAQMYDYIIKNDVLQFKIDR